MKIYLATDHAGFELKNQIREWLEQEGYIVVDCGAEHYDPEDDFPDFISQAAAAVAREPGSMGVIFGGSGQGEAMAANRFQGVRAAIFYGGDESIVPLSRQHNNANILSLGARFVSADVAKRVIWEWLHTDFLSAEKYERRNVSLDALPT